MTLPITRYELDKTGKNPNNKVEGEVHTLSSKELRAVAPKHGAFYTESIKVYDDVLNTPLVKNEDYVCTELAKEATLQYGKEVCYIVLITNKDVSGRVRISYQAVGGAYSNIADEVVTLYETAMKDNRKVDWNNIINKPYGFPPKLHNHLLKDVVGFEPLIDAINRLGNSVTLSNVPAFETLIEKVNTDIQDFITTVDQRVYNFETNIDNTVNTNITTYFNQHLGDNLNAYFEQNIGGNVNETFTTINNDIRVIKQTLNNHKNDKSNPHEVTKEQLGLGNVENLPIATEEDLALDPDTASEEELNKYVTLKQLLRCLKDYKGSGGLDEERSARLSVFSSSISKNGSITVNVNTTNIEDGQTLYWKIEHVSTTTLFFVHSYGYVTINNNQGQFIIESTDVVPSVNAHFNIVLTVRPSSTAYYDRVDNLVYLKEQEGPITPDSDITAESMFLSPERFEVNGIREVSSSSDYRATDKKENVDSNDVLTSLSSMLAEGAAGYYFYNSTIDMDNTTEIDTNK